MSVLWVCACLYWGGVGHTFGMDRAEAIRTQLEVLDAEIEAIPQESINLAPWTLGWRSEPSDSPQIEIHLQLDFEEPAPVDLIVLMPATFTDDGEDLQPYGFPLRFSLEGILPNGDLEVLKDHRSEDYLIDGVGPQLFELDSSREYVGIRLSIYKIPENNTWTLGAFRGALSEMYVFSGDRNIALNQPVSVSSADNHSYVWSPEALVDGFSLYSPIERVPQSPNETSFRVKNIQFAQLVFDLGEVSSFDEFRFWPLIYGLQFNYPPTSGIGFPRGILIESSLDADFEDSTIIYDNPEIYPTIGSNPLMLRTDRSQGRYVRMTFFNLVDDRRIGLGELAIDEIQILDRGRLLSEGIVPTTNIQDSKHKGISTLTDGLTSEGKILRQKSWLVAFALRSELVRLRDRLHLEYEIAQRQESERATFIHAATIGVIIILILTVCLVVLLARRHWIRMRERIACDLHDDIGANMASVAHRLELAQHYILNRLEGSEELIEGAIKTSRATAEDTRKIVRFLEYKHSVIRWEEDLEELAAHILCDLEYSIDVSAPISLKKLNTSRSWDLLLFIKEAFSNAAKHAQASFVHLSFSDTAGRLQLAIRDNGLGIPDTKLPVRHLESRAKRLGARLKVDSKINEGTSICLIF